jgi:hypothetical protein
MASLAPFAGKSTAMIAAGLVVKKVVVAVVVAPVAALAAPPGAAAPLPGVHVASAHSLRTTGQGRAQARGSAASRGGRANSSMQVSTITAERPRSSRPAAGTASQESDSFAASVPPSLGAARAARSQKAA